MLQYGVVPRGDGMEKFTRTLRGYDPDEVNAFLDKIIGQVEGMVSEIKEKDKKIAEQNQKLVQQNKRISELQGLEEENKNLKQKAEQFGRMEATMSKAIVMAQKTSEQLRVSAQRESDAMVDEAKKNANRIINEALLKAEKTEREANTLRRNINIFKRRVKDIVEAQLEVVNELDEVEL